MFTNNAIDAPYANPQLTRYLRREALAHPHSRPKRLAPDLERRYLSIPNHKFYLARSPASLIRTCCDSRTDAGYAGRRVVPSSFLVAPQGRGRGLSRSLSSKVGYGERPVLLSLASHVCSIGLRDLRSTISSPAAYAPLA